VIDRETAARRRPFGYHNAPFRRHRGSPAPNWSYGAFDACERALKYFDAFHGGEPKAWFLTIVRHAGYDWIKRNRPAEFIPDGTEALERAVDTVQPTPEQAALRNASGAALSEAIAALPLGYREVLILRELEEMPYRDIARVVDIPIGTVMSRLARARALLQRSPLLAAIRERSGGA